MSAEALKIFSSVNEIKEVASRVGVDGAANVLVGFGIVLTLLDLGGQTVGDFDTKIALPPAEFIAVLAVSVLALLGGAAMRLYVFKREIELDEKIATKARVV